MTERPGSLLTSGSIVTLGVFVVILLACLAVLFVPAAFEASAAQRTARQYLTAINKSDATTALQECQYAELGHIRQEIAWWGGAEIQDVRFDAFNRMNPSYGPVRVLAVSFSYRRPGQTSWEQGFLRMFWLFRDGTLWTMPSPETCRGSNGYYGS